MYHVIVVDDEPTAVDFVQNLIEKKTADFKVVATAGNALECLDLVERHHPDVVITDIKMPVMDGIELIQNLNRRYPQIITLLVSGYEDFNYARAALKYNAVDYIKKPITPKIFSDSMQKVKEMLDALYYEERNRTIRKLSRGTPVDDQIMKKYFPDGPYFTVLVRKNGLPRRFLGNKENEIFSEAHESIIIYGRDEMESLYLIARSMLFEDERQTLDQYIQKILKRETDASYTTIIASREPIQYTDFSERFSQLYMALNRNTIIGKSQVIYLEDIRGVGPGSDQTQMQMLKKLEYFVSQHQRDKMKHEIAKLFKTWADQEKPQIQVEECVNQIIYIFKSYGECGNCGSGIEFQLEDAFGTAPNMDVLAENIESLLFESGEQRAVICGSKVDTPEFFELIRRHIQAKIAEALSLQSVAKEFGISPAYISKLFRKYEDNSFNNYLTSIRMEKAKSLMNGDQNLYVKDIAAMVGYSDQFYFSRLFRSYVGLCPMDYLSSLK